jgi:cystathionine beta-lyase
LLPAACLRAGLENDHMPDDIAPPARPSGKTMGFNTLLSHAGRPGSRAKGLVNPPVMRGSTVLQPSCAERSAVGKKWREQELIYGVMGTPTHFALEDMVAAIEGGTRCQIVSSGLAAVTTPLLGYLKAGDNLLMPDSVYAPTRHFCETLLAQLGIETTWYRPTIDATELKALLRPNTSVLFLESPGSHTFEMQDVPALAEVAHAHGAKVMIDNTWGLHFFQPFRFGVDVSIQALTKYAGGHADLLLGAVTTATDVDWERVRGVALALGQYASPDDCWLALRGARMESGLHMARWFAARPEVAKVLHPALPGAPGHEIWKRDFTGAPSLFGVVFKPEIAAAQVTAMIDALELFGIGASWGGYESLVLHTQPAIRRTLETGLGGEAARFHIGLEDTADLIADLERAFAHLR